MKDMKKTAALLAAMALLGMGSASAAEAAPMYALKGITVTANRQAESLKDVPASVQVITEKDIKLRNVQTAADAVAMATGVSASNSVEGTVNLRGYNSKNILVLVDGQQMNTAWDGDVDWNMIPVENIRKIEVVSGGQSALYGGRAIGGVINIMTKSEKRDGVHGSAIVSYGSHDTVKQAYAVQGKKDKLSWGTFYESKSTNGWNSYLASATLKEKKKGDGNFGSVQGYDTDADGKPIVGDRGKKYVMSESYGFNMGYQFNDDQKLTYKYTHSNYVWRYTDPVSFLKNGAWSESLNNTNGTQVKVTPATLLGKNGWRSYDMHSLTYNDQKNKVHAHFGMTDYTKDGYTSISSTNKETEGAGSKSSYPSKSWDFDINKRWNWGDHTVLAGLSYGKDRFDLTASSVNDWKSWNSKGTVTQTAGGKDKYWALYAQDKWKLTEKWTAYLGGRYDHYTKYDGYDSKNMAANINQSKSYSQFSPKLSLDYAWNDDTNLYLSYGKSFNTPILYQLYRYSTMGSVKTYPNPMLEPETTDTWELGMKKNLSGKTDLHVDAFYAKTNDAITSVYIDKPNNKKQYQNVGEAKTHGFEIAVNQKHSDSWTSYINYTWQTGKIDGDKNYDIPRHLLHLGTTFHKDPWTVNIDGMFISDRTEAGMKSGCFKARDAYFLLNLNTNYQFNKNFSVQFAIENVLDREYFDEDISTNHYYIGDGRTFTLTARYAF